MKVQNHTERRGGVLEYGGVSGCATGTTVPSVTVVRPGKCKEGITSVSLNLSLAISQLGRRVLLFDTVGDVDLNDALVSSYEYIPCHSLRGRVRIDGLVVNEYAEVMVLRVSSGLLSMSELETDERLSLLAQIDDLVGGYDMVVIDADASKLDNTLFFSALTEEILMVVTPEAGSIKGAYALMEVLAEKCNKKKFKVLVDGVVSKKEGLDVYRRFGFAIDELTSISVDYMGSIVQEKDFAWSRGSNKVVTGSNSHLWTYRSHQDVARELCYLLMSKRMEGGVQFFGRHAMGGEII